MNVGSLIAYLDLDDSNFDRKTKNANRQIDGLKLHLETLEKMNPKVTVDVRTKTAELQALQADLAALKARAAEGEDVKVDTAEAMFKLAALKTEIRSLHAEAMKPIEVKVNQSELDKLAAKLDNIGGKMRGVGGPQGMLSTVLAFGPMLGAGTNAAVGLLGAVTAGAVEAAGAVGILAAALKGVAAGESAYATYQHSMSMATTAKQRATAQKALDNSAYGSMSDAGKAFVAYNVSQVKPFKADLSNTIQQGVLPGMTDGLHGLIADAPQIKSAIAEISASLGGLISEAGHALQSPFWRQWLVWFGHDSANNVHLMGHAVGEVTEGIARGMERAAGGTHSLIQDADRLAVKFNHWTGSPQFAQWLDTVKADGHDVAQVLSEVWQVAKPLLTGMGAAGREELTVLSGALSVIAGLPTGFLETAGHLLPEIILAAKIGTPFVNGLGAAFQFSGNALKTWAEAGTIERMGMASGALTKVGASIKGLAGPVGLGLLFDSTTHAAGAMNTLESAAGGAALGFSVGGPWGAAIGGSIGLLLGGARAAGLFAHQLSDTQVIDNARSAYSNLADTLDQVTGAFTQMTRSQTLADIQKNGTLKAALKVGLTPRQAVDLALGTADKSTLAHFNSAMGHQNDLYATNHAAATNNGHAAMHATPQMVQASSAAAATKGEIDLLTALTGAGQRAATQWANNITSTRVWTSEQIKLANSLGNTGATAAILDGKVKPLTKSVENLAKQYNLTPKQVTTVVQLLGADKSRVDLSTVLSWMRQQAGQGVTVPVHIGGIVGGPISAAGAGIAAAIGTVTKNLGHGLPGHAGGTPFTFHSDMLVGEMGPEILRNVPKGSQIIPNNQTRQILSGHGGGATAPRMHPADLQALAHLLGAAAAQHAHDAVHNALSRY